MEQRKIKSISEAFSMQPCTLEVITPEVHVNYFDKENAIKEIKMELIQVNDNERESYYVGYDYLGRRQFEYVAKSVNVHYYYTEDIAEHEPR